MLNELIRRAAPMHAAMLVLGAGNMVEALSLSRLGQEQLLAYGHVLPLLLLLDAIGLGLGAGAASLFARAEPSRRAHISHCCLMCALILGFILLAILVLVCGFPGADNSSAQTYLHIWAPTIPFALLNLTALALLRAADRSPQAARAIVLGGGLHAAVTPILIFGAGFVPAMGLSGAALAHTLAAVSVSAALITAKALPLTPTPLARATLRNFAGPLLKLALPAALSNLSVPVGAALLMSLLRGSHEGYVAAFALALRIEGFCLVAFYAYSSVIGPLAVAAREEWGADAFFAHIKTCCQHCLILGAGLAGILGFLPLTLHYWLSPCPDSIAPLQHYFWTVPLSYGAYGLVMLANGVFNGLGRPYCGLLISTLRCLILLLPMALLMDHIWPGHGVYVAITASNGVSAVAAFFLLKRVCTFSNNLPAVFPTHPFERKIL